ncbi:MAG: sigma-54 dependent transcriptional regulator, acetoin dehydrogenase operon transcriptional [Kribbellaceae bacterium]|nr:sigma-54 dependent transcriptional regulator, acetoin dehydrogenase operon transcriptional [Kribbellaceae bacterium]
MEEEPAVSRRIAAARIAFLTSGGAVGGVVPDLVEASWRRSYSAGVNAATVEARYHADLDMSSRLVRCSEPVIERLSQEAADLPLSIALTDGKARILTRTDTDRAIGARLEKVDFAPGFDYAEGGVGTNGVGTVFESGQPVHIIGPQHFHERLQPFSCAGAPIRDPISGRIEGVLDITSLAGQSSPLMHTLARSAAHDIAQNLLADRSLHQQALFETFVRMDGRTRGAVMAVGGTVVIANTMAQTLFDPGEQLTIQQHTRYLMARRDEPVDQLELPTGKVVRIRGVRIFVGGDVAGLVVELLLVAEGTVPLPKAPLMPFSLPAATASSRRGGAALRGAMSSVTDGQSPSWKRAGERITAALSRQEALLVMGERGTGKFSLVAEIYHRVNPGGRSLAIHAAEITRDSYDEAEEALEATTVPTLYILRNIDDLSTDGVERLQAFLLAVADSDLPVLVAATLTDANLDSDLPFRELLVHFQHSVTVPPLRHRTEDLPVVASRVLAAVADRRGVTLSPAAMRVIARYSWPRNISQLEEAISSALLKRPVGELQPEDLPGYCHNAARRQLAGIEAVERDAIVKALHDAAGNRSQAAAALGIARSSLYRKLKSYGITTI